MKRLMMGLLALSVLAGGLSGINWAYDPPGRMPSGDEPPEGGGGEGGGPTPPTASFTFMMSNLTVTFTSTATAGSSPIISYQWNFGDGQGGSGSQAVHTYATAGTYTVVHTVTDQNNLSGTLSQAVVVAVPLPTASMVWRSVSSPTMTISLSLTTSNALHFTLDIRLKDIGPIEDKKLGFIGPDLMADGWFQRTEVIGNLSGSAPGGTHFVSRQKVSAIQIATRSDNSTITVTLKNNEDDSPEAEFVQPAPISNQIFVVDNPGVQESITPPFIGFTRVEVRYNFLSWVILSNGTDITSTKLQWYVKYVFSVNPDGSLTLVAGESESNQGVVDWPPPSSALGITR